MGAGSSKHYYDLLTAPDWSQGVDTITLVADVFNSTEKLAADRCGKHATKVNQKCCELRGVRDAWNGMHHAAGQLHGQQVYQVAQDMQALSLKLSWCKARLLRASKSPALTKTAQQHAAKLQRVLAVACEACSRYQINFTSAAVGTQQPHSSTGQQEPRTARSSKLCTATVQQGSAAPGLSPVRLQEGSCSSPGTVLVPVFLTTCAESAACQQQQQQQQQQPALEDLQGAGLAAVLTHSSAAPSYDGTSYDQQPRSTAAAKQSLAASAGLEAEASAAHQAVPPGPNDNLGAAALVCMLDCQRSWALLQQAAGAPGAACHLMGQMAEQGLGLPAADYEQAAAWYGHGAALQDAASAHALAFALENGLGVERDLHAAKDWYLFAAEGGHAAAQNNLGRLLMASKGGQPADTGRALAWLQAAAEQGSTAAWYNMGMCFDWGVGECAVDAESAQECYWHAAQQGHQAALLRLKQLQLVSNEQASAAFGGTGHRSGICSSSPGSHCLSLNGARHGNQFMLQEEDAVQSMHHVLADLQQLDIC